MSQDGLPHSAAEFESELRRRLELLDQEVKGLDSTETHDRFLASRAVLESARTDLLRLLAAGVADERNWAQRRGGIILVWRRYRRRFEQLADAWQRRHAARTGQSEKGPRW